MQYICQVLTDTHPKVQAAGQTALQEVMFALIYHDCMLLCFIFNGLCFVFFCQVGSVIKNPEISALVPILLSALTDPNDHTKHSLDILLQVIRSKIVFTQTVDFRSLASPFQLRI